MRPRARSGDEDVNLKVYSSKKPPKQVHFPHKTKTIRRRTTAQDGSGKRQMIFLPEKMKEKGRTIVRDSSDEEDEVVDTEQSGAFIDTGTNAEEVGSPTRAAGPKTNRKRKSDGTETNSAGAEELVGSTPKRRRKTPTSKSKVHSRRIKLEAEANHEAASIETGKEEDIGHRFRRQSTMTQLADGRQPLPGTKDPEFKPVKRSLRTSWGGRGGKAYKDRQQRTLTQMIPGMRPLEMSDDDLEEMLSDAEAQETEHQPYRATITEQLALQGLYQPGSDSDQEADEQKQVKSDPDWLIDEEQDDELPMNLQNNNTLVVDSVEDDYQPTQYIEAPATRNARASRQGHRTEVLPRTSVLAGSSRTSKPRFGLLSTPEKRRIREIPSSQSPAESPLSTQVTPQKTNRSPLKEVSWNATVVPETPSKFKQVTFERSSKKTKSPPTLRKFQSTIQDSEDEDEDIIEEDLPSKVYRLDRSTSTQNLLHDETFVSTSSAEIGLLNAAQKEVRPSPELGESSVYYRQSPYHTSYALIKKEPLDDAENPGVFADACALSPEKQPVVDQDRKSNEDVLLTPREEFHSTPPPHDGYTQDSFPSTPMVIKDESSDDEIEQDFVPSSRSPSANQPLPSSHAPQSALVEGATDQSRRSPSAQQETQQSHSSKAELQLQNEWLSYSQYINRRAPASSSMNVTHDPFSYNAAGLLSSNSNAVPPQSSGNLLSQATTVDEVTPKKKKRSTKTSANTTPRKVAGTQTLISPSKPPPLFIPSSFPSPTKAAMEGWSSPPLMWTQDGPAGFHSALRSSQIGASIEDFSIPPPPPVEDD